MNTQELLSLCDERLSYNHKTGTLTWLTSPSRSRAVVGREAGGIRPRGYRGLTINNKSYQSHRIAFLMFHGYLPDQVDHINGLKLDNRACNLRAATNMQNCRNKGPMINNKAGYKGVFRQGNMWRAQIHYGDKRAHLGSFACKIEAAKAYNEAAIKFHGEFAFLNKV